MVTKHNYKYKLYTLGLIIVAIIFIIALMLNTGSRGSNYIANRSAKPLYIWKSGALQVRGRVVPDTCALTTKNCTCNLSESISTCTLNFNFHDISESVSIQTKQDKALIPSITLNKSMGCSDSKQGQITNCSLDFQWNKKDPTNETINIVMAGSMGDQTLVNLQINAK